jgi:hypothetical protein
MNEQLTPMDQEENLNPEGITVILRVLESFFQEYPDNVIEHLESMLYDWYRYAQEHYEDKYVNEVVNRTFKVNDLLLNLADAMLLLKDTEVSAVDELVDGSFEFRHAS